MRLAIAWRQPLAALLAVAIAMTWSTLTLATRPAEGYQAQEGLRTQQDQVSKFDESNTFVLASAGLPEVFAASGPLTHGPNLQLAFVRNQDPNLAAFRIEGGNEFFMSPFASFTGKKESDTTGTASASMSFDSERGRWFLEAVKPHLDIDLASISKCDVTVNLEDIGDTMLATKATLKLWKDGAVGRAVGATLGAVANGIGGFAVGAFDSLTSHAKLQPKRDPLVQTTPEFTVVEFVLPDDAPKRAQAEQRAAQQQQQQQQQQQAQRAARSKVRLTPRARESSPAEQPNNCNKVKCGIGDTVTGTYNKLQFVGTVYFVFEDGLRGVNDMKSESGGPFTIGSLAFSPDVLQLIKKA